MFHFGLGRLLKPQPIAGGDEINDEVCNPRLK